MLRLLMAALAAAFFFACPAWAETVGDLYAATSIPRDSGFDNRYGLDRKEFATAVALGAGLGYRFPVPWGRLTASIGIDYLANADGDWGNNSARQLIRIQSLGFPVELKYDVTEASVLGFYPVVMVGAGPQYNKLTHQMTVTKHCGKTRACIGDDTSNLTFRWHAGAGIARDFGKWSLRGFARYTDRGSVTASDCVGGRGSLRAIELGVGASVALW